MSLWIALLHRNRREALWSPLNLRQLIPRRKISYPRLWNERASEHFEGWSTAQGYWINGKAKDSLVSSLAITETLPVSPSASHGPQARHFPPLSFSLDSFSKKMDFEKEIGYNIWLAQELFQGCIWIQNRSLGGGWTLRKSRQLTKEVNFFLEEWSWAKVDLAGKFSCLYH